MPTNDETVNVEIWIIFFLAYKIFKSFFVLSNSFILLNYQFALYFGLSNGKPVTILIIYGKEPNFKITDIPYKLYFSDHRKII